MDANFRLKNRERVIKNDVSLSDGWGHWVPLGPFLEHVQAQAQDAEVRATLTVAFSTQVSNFDCT